MTNNGIDAPAMMVIGYTADATFPLSFSSRHQCTSLCKYSSQVDEGAERKRPYPIDFNKLNQCRHQPILVRESKWGKYRVTYTDV